MNGYDFGGFRVEIDEETTRDYYSGSVAWDCSCGHCRNYALLARERKLPVELLELLDKLGIPPEKANYVCELYDKDGKLYYQADYRVAGRILGEPEEKVPLPREMTLRCGRETAPGSADDFPEPFFDLMCFFWLPWTLPEPMEGSVHKLLISSNLEDDVFETEQLLWQVIPAALEAEGVEVPCEVNVLLTNDGGIQEINRAMREMDAPTDVLSFPMFDLTPGDKPTEADADPATGLVPLGDMCISLERARAQAEEYGHSEARETAYLAVHSVLHLLGYDHLDEGPMKAQMRAREEAVMETLGLSREG